jgi:hypothetical protein
VAFPERTGVESTACGSFSGVLPEPNGGCVPPLLCREVKSRLPSRRTPNSAMEEDSSACAWERTSSL